MYGVHNRLICCIIIVTSVFKQYNCLNHDVTRLYRGLQLLDKLGREKVVKIFIQSQQIIVRVKNIIQEL